MRLLQRVKTCQIIRYLWLLVTLTACQHVGLTASSDTGHLALPAELPETKPISVPPLPVTSALLGSPSSPPLTYTLSVNRVNIQDFLFALAREAKLNIDIHPDIQGQISLNAVEQSLPQLLERLSRQIDLRHELVDGVLRILPDTPYLVHYPVDYVNINRQITSTLSANTQISSGPSSDLRALAQSASGTGNISNTRLENTTTHQFWLSLERNIQDILRETDKMLPEGSSDTITQEDQQHAGFGVRSNPQNSHQSKPPRQAQNSPAALFSLPQPQPPAAESSNSQNRETRIVKTRTFREAASVIVNPEGGQISVRATAKQHATVQEFLQKTLQAAHRQVLIEASIIEVELTEGYQQGIDWSRVSNSGNQNFSVTRADVGGDPTSGILPFALRNQDKRTSLSSSVALDLLRSFGKVRVLSSPRLTVMNNQAAILKVVENIIYFSVKADTVVTANVGPTTTVTTTPQSVSVGLVMSVTPQISESQQIILNVRPTISSIAKFVPDPNPVIPIPNQVPQIRTREIESILSLQPGEIAILGGLMEDRSEQKTGQLPGLADIPLLGEFFTTRHNSSRKSELVVLLRPLRQDVTTPQVRHTQATSNAIPEIDEIFWLDVQDSIAIHPRIPERLRTLQTLQGQSPALWLAIGNSQVRRQDYPSAQSAYRMAAKLAPDNPDPTANLALSLQLQGATWAAQTYYQKTLEILARGDSSLKTGPAACTVEWVEERLKQLAQSPQRAGQ